MVQTASSTGTVHRTSHFHPGMTSLSDLLQQCRPLCADMRQACCSISLRRTGALQPGTIALPWLSFLQVNDLTLFAICCLNSIAPVCTTQPAPVCTTQSADLANCQHSTVKLETLTNAHSCSQPPLMRHQPMSSDDARP